MYLAPSIRACFSCGWVVFASLFPVCGVSFARPQNVATNSAAKQAYNKVIGVVDSVAPDGKKITVKPDTGSPTDVLLDENTSFMLVPPGEKDLRKATRIEAKDVKPGDRVYARSRKGEGQDQTPAVSVFVMSQADVAQHQEKSRAEWQRRGAAGKITAVDPAAKTVTIAVQAAGGAKDLVIATDDKTTFRRYAPDSVKFSDAVSSNFGALAVGNNVRVLGNKNADGTTLHAEELVSGSFRNLAGTVISVDAAANEIKISDLQTKKPVTVKVNADTNLRKLAPEMAMMIARTRAAAPGTARAPGATGPAGAPQSQPKGQGGPDSHPGFNGPAGPPAGTPAGSASGAAPGVAGDRPGSAGAGPGSGGAGRMDMNQMLERAPQFTLADLKPGDALIVSSANAADASRANAIAVVAGVETILAATPSGGGQSGPGAGAWTLDIGLPQ